MINKAVDRKTIVLILTVGLFVIGIVNVSYALPYFIGVGDTSTRSVHENADPYTNVGDPFLVDRDAELVSFDFPDHSDKFKIYANSTKDQIQIKTRVLLDYEEQSSYTVRLIVKYLGASIFDWIVADTVTITIDVIDEINEPLLVINPPYSILEDLVGVISSGDASPTLTSEERKHITSLLTLDTVIFNELFNASNDLHDWVELRNVTDTDVDLSGWHLIVATGETTEVFEFPTGTVLPAEELLLVLNTDPSDPDMPLATYEEPSYRSLVDETFILPQEDFMLLLRSPSAWEDNAGGYLFGEERSPTTVDFALDTAWFRARSTVLGHEANAWVVSGYHDGLGYDSDTPEDISLGTPGYPHETIIGDANGDGIVNILDLVLVASQIGESDETVVDINGDGIVNIQDLVVIANRLGHTAAAPSAHALTAGQVEQWLSLAKQTVSRPIQIQTSLSQSEFSYEHGIWTLEQLLRMLVPKETTLLANFPNPFNPETWIPYQLATASDVHITIYDWRGTLVRQFDLGHQPAGLYQDRSRAVYWDGTNELGESVASGIYFYTLITDDFSATRKMLILK